MPVILRGDARSLPLPDESVDLIVTSPPYFGLRSYTDGGEHYDGQVGSEGTPREFIDALIACTAEMVRVLKPSGSIFVNLGDKYAQSTERSRNGLSGALDGGKPIRDAAGTVTHARRDFGVPVKSLALLPERYRIAAVDQLGLTARAVIVWSKPNGLPESVTDRVRRSHEDWVHLTKAPRYFSAVDEIRQPYEEGYAKQLSKGYSRKAALEHPSSHTRHREGFGDIEGWSGNPLGKLPGSVWEIATQPLKVPAELGVDHFAAFPMDWPRRLILGWSPREVCTGCGEGRRPVTDKDRQPTQRVHNGHGFMSPNHGGRDSLPHRTLVEITGYACACPDTSAPATPGVVLDPFSGTGTTALVATMLGRHGIGVDLSADYCRLAAWRAADPKERARAAGLDPDDVAKVRPQLPGQFGLFGEAS